MNRNDDDDVVTLPLKLVTRRIDCSVQETLRNIKTLHQARSLLHVGGHKGQLFLKLRISLASRPHDVFEEFVRGLMHVSIEDHSAQHELWTFSNIQTQSIRRFDHVVHVHFRVAVFPVKNFEEEGQIVRARGT